MKGGGGGDARGGVVTFGLGRVDIRCGCGWVMLWVELCCGWSCVVGGVMLWVELCCGWSYIVGGVMLWRCG